MPKIRILSADVANKIAAGEVVERPASVVKELIENAIDAESTSIRVEIRAGGKSLIRVSDNGTGMEREDALLALERHATSKVNNIEDLENINTFGFRGEALASIASVSQFELLTRTVDAVQGTKISVDGGVFRSVEESGCSPGTHISINNLFHNVPARLKFMKTETTEINHITKQVTWAALAHPKIHFVLSHNGRTILDVRACDSNLERARLVYGKEFADNLIEFNEELPDFKLSGMLGKPDFNKPNREYQLFFMNQRPIRSSMIAAALKEGLSATIQKDRHAVAVLFMTLEPNTVDVNVHPAKIEVRFRNERTIFSGIVKMIRNVINKEKFIPKIETSVNRTPERTHTEDVPDGIARVDTHPRNKAHTITQQPATPQTYPTDRNVERKQTPFGETRRTKKTESEPIHTEPNIDEGSKTDTEVPRTVVQPSQQSIPEGVKLKLLDFENVELKTNLFKTYIVAEGEDKVFFIDQHVAAERVLYERFVNQLKSNGIPVQGLLLPVTVEVTPQQIAVFKVHGEIFEKLGFELEEFGGNTILIRAMPAPLPTRAAAQTVTDILDKLPEQPHAEVALPKAIDDALITLACRAAVKAGDTLDAKEMINLVRELSEAKLPFNCPHSRPIIIEMERDELERRFHRQ
ncbi:DNA mismatch repair endonuclease MutL [Candidatus Poribacteria bacterium]|nr:DNA mismatch repair endonuclease MutL [Candidatus Poribacteria bacterium]MYB63907.1 DNA mismatch repair endonuclease MutL [Candidatus Poribacteria bacterium]MYF55639.1 DNA mismatch repair endonuclease MutL [Candidatus Poribacteria bacterium]MYI94990.1 DNA mismatch repair endonuclease MutL [Candidatus Poribacteria bacterium]